MRATLPLSSIQTETLREMLVVDLAANADELAARRAAVVIEAADDPSGLNRAISALHLFAALHEMDEIRAALRRVAAGRYGTCLACFRPLSFEDLRGLPQARTCSAFSLRRSHQLTCRPRSSHGHAVA